jgi:hypothetical protein
MTKQGRKVLLVLSLVVFHWSADLWADESHPTLCRPGEQVFFNCRVKDGRTIVSLCGSKDLTAHEGYLQYRFGREGHVELEFPAQRQETQNMFRYAQYSRYQVNRVAISFQRAGFTYVLFDSYEGDAPAKTHQQGVQVEPAGGAGKAATFLCRGTARGNLYSLSSILPCDQDDPLNMGACP